MAMNDSATRVIRILVRLMEGPATIPELREAFKISGSTLNRHLNTIEAAVVGRVRRRLQQPPAGHAPPADHPPTTATRLSGRSRNRSRAPSRSQVVA